jgi:hypothetical protein
MTAPKLGFALDITKQISEAVSIPLLPLVVQAPKNILKRSFKKQKQVVD